MPRRPLIPMSAGLIDPALPDLAWVASPDRLGELLSRDVGPELLGCPGPVEAEILDLTYTPGRRCTALCRVTGGSQLVVTMTSGGKAAAAYQDHYAPDHSRALYLADRRILVERFPSDWALPGLPTATSPTTMVGLLPDARWGLGELAIELLHYRPHRRAVISYRSAGDPDASPRFVGKLYRSGAEVSTALDRLMVANRVLVGEGISTPAARGQVAGLELLLMDHVPGRSLKHLLQHDGSDDRTAGAVEQAARAIATLHRHHEAQPSARDAATELDRLRKRLAPLAFVAPELAGRAAELIDRISERLGDLPPGQARFLHGDFTPSQVLVADDGSVVLVDFDLSEMGDPAVDVANFVSKLRRRARRSGDNVYRSLGVRFIDEYVRHAPPDAGLAERVTVIEATALVRTAVRSFRHAPGSPSDDDPMWAVYLAEADEAVCSLSA